MCGICGKISLSGKPIDPGLIKRMCGPMTFRGPDHEGLYTGGGGPGEPGVGLGHSRLSILDLSEAGHQPMANEDETVWITYNGEIYNAFEIRPGLIDKGHRFRSNTDTEVILHLYEEEGPDLVKRLNGMFAFGLWDRNRKRFILCRDRIGIKPLIYYHQGDSLLFASEIKSILRDPAVKREIDYQALMLYLAYSYIPAPYTIFKGIRKLEPGSILILENQSVNFQRYWSIPGANQEPAKLIKGTESLAEIKHRLFDTLQRSVERRLLSDVPLGAFLSGGLDSSVIVALMARLSENTVKTFSIGFKDNPLFDETRYAREVARMYHTDHREFRLTYRDMLDALFQVMETFDEPFSDSSALPTYILSRETRKHVTVALSGDGGDELFAGYRSYMAEYFNRLYSIIPGVIRREIIEKTIDSLPDSRETRILEHIRRTKKFLKSTKGSLPERMLSLKEIIPLHLRKEVLAGNMDFNSLPDPALGILEKRLGEYKGDRINTILYSDLSDSLACDMLTKVDWMSMRNSLEVRVPILDHEMVELAFLISGKLKLNKWKTKYIFKETFKDLLPKSLHKRPKSGFEVPISRWLKSDLKFLLDEYLSKDKIKAQGVFDPEVTEFLVNLHLSNKTDTSWALWNLIVFGCWFDRYFNPG